MPDENSAEDDYLVEQVTEFKREAELSRQKRDQLDRRNEAAVYAEQDFSHKIEGQSREFIPATGETLEQMAAFFKNGLIQFGNWFSVSGRSLPIRSENIRSLMQQYLNDLGDGQPFHIKVSDGAKMGLVKSLMIFKIHGKEVERRRNFTVGEDGKVVENEEPVWKLQIDLIDPKDMYLDPTGRDLYKIHHIERDLHDVIALAEKGVYKKEEVKKLIGTDQEPEEQERKNSKSENRDETAPNKGNRKRVQLDEFWGTILNKDGTVKHDRVLITVANGKHVIRGPEKFPFWHGRDPFVVAPLIRYPGTVLHRALYDDAVPLNLAMNELFNLNLDGGIAAVWGIRQLRMDLLENPADVADGIGQGATLSIRADAPQGVKVLEQVTEGQLPPDGIQMYNTLKTEFNSAVLTNAIRSGEIPTKQVRATEVAASTQSQDFVMDSITNDVEWYIQEVLEKSWLTILQNADDLQENEVAEALTVREQFMLATMTPAERFVTMGRDCTFKVYGISQTLAKARDFQRLMAFIGTMAQNPITAPALLRKYDPVKILETGFKSINVDPKSVERDDNEQSRNELVQDLGIASQLSLGGSQGNARVPGEPGIQSEINQLGAPTDGGVPA